MKGHIRNLSRTLSQIAAVLFVSSINATSLAVVAAAPATSLAEGQPNVVVIVADDLGYGDLGCYGATKIKTPNIDRLAAAGVRFTDAHAPAAHCVPSRYSILSGKYMMRAHKQGQRTLFREGEVTLPSLMKTAGYRTGAIGKWHLGFGRNADPDYNADLMPGPLEIGFSYFFGCPRTPCEPPFVFVENHRVLDYDPVDPIRIIGKETKPGWGHGVSEGGASAHAARPLDRIDPILADKAVTFISQTSEQPFFLYLAFVAPHVPHTPAAEFHGTSQAGRYGDFVQQLDACVGKVLDALRAQGLSENTLVCFTSDNGAICTQDVLHAGHRPNGLLLGQKLDAWEGGHRVPFIATWPSQIPPGTTCDRLLCLTDLLATIAAAVNLQVPDGAAEDSINQLTLLKAPEASPSVRSEMLSQGASGYAIRQGDWVYLPRQGSMGWTVPYDPRSGWAPFPLHGNTNSDIDDVGQIKPTAPLDQLYNLAEDPEQKINRTLQYPEKAAAMRSRLGELVRPLE